MFSGVELFQPVVCLKTGYVFEQSVVFHCVKLSGKCPLSGIEVNFNDFVPIQPDFREKCRESDIEKVGFILEQIRERWIEIVLQNFMIRMQNEEMRNEASLVLSQHQVAVMSIARVLGENEVLSEMLNGVNKDIE